MQVHCPKHKDSHLLYIFQKENEIEFICDQCHSDLTYKNQKISFQDLISIKKAKQCPEYLFSKITNSEKLQEFFYVLIQNDEENLRKQITTIEQQIKEVQDQLNLMQQELYIYKKKYMELRQQLRENLEQVIMNYNKIINFDQFKNCITELENAIDPQEICQSQSNVDTYFKNSIKNKFISINNQIFTLLEYKNQYMKEPKPIYPEWKKLEKLYQQLNRMHLLFDNIINPQFPGNIDNTQLITKEFQAKLIDIIVKISQKQITNIKLIDQEVKSNFNIESFWNKVDGKDNLLMVFQSQSTAIFGAYTPCQWVKNKKGQYVQDETLTSFIFSQTNNKIYPIKNDGKASAIYCCTQYGPIFGGTSLYSGSIMQYFKGKNDLMIYSDFQNGSSTLGISYATETNSIETEYCLFGEKTPKIIMYEIFQLSFN